MADVISFDDRKAALEGQAPAASTAFSTPEPEESEKSSCMQAAGALAMACAEWSLILMHSPSPQGIALLAEARLLVRDLLLLGGVAPPHIGIFRRRRQRNWRSASA